MSEGPRIPLPVARAAAAKLMQLWGMAEPACLVVGSVRREKPDVGDLEFIAPHKDGPYDSLFDLINSTCADAEGMFASKPTAERFAVPEKGLKRGFKFVSLACHMTRQDGSKWVIPVQIHRYGAGNRGWIELMRTGPDEFGRLFLHEWKQKWGGSKGSVDGHLVDGAGKPVKVESEAEAFKLCGLPAVEPRDRARYAHMRNFT